MTNLLSTAPHIHQASEYNDLVDWGAQPNALPHTLPDAGGVASHSYGRLLWKTPVSRPEVGLWHCTPGRWRLSVPRNEFLWVMGGKATYKKDKTNGDINEVTIGKDDALLFPAGWQGEAVVEETLQVTYMLSASEAQATTPKHHLMLRNPLAATALKDWGVIPTMVEGESRTAGLLLHREANPQPGLTAECGFWTCTPGYWQCHVTSHEYCHFIAGRATYTHEESGEVIEIMPDTVALFPKDWRGTCRVHETVKKLYMIM